MLRRCLLTAVAASAAVFLGACAPSVPEEIVVTPADIEAGLRQHFPKHFPVAGLLQLDMQQPALRLLPVSNQIETTLPVQLSGKALPSVYQGHMQLRFGLQYSVKDYSVRSQRVQVLALQLDGAAPALADMLQAYGTRLAQQAMDGVVLYTVPEEQQMLMHKLGVQPGAIVVTDEGLRVHIERPAQR